MELTAKSIAIIIIGIISFICINWILSYKIRNIKMKNKKKRCSRQTTGIVKDIIEVNARRNGQDIYYTLVQIEYLDGYAIKEKTRDREIGDIQTIYYNPEVPEDAVSELMMNEALSDNALKGFLQFISAFIFFVSIAAFMFFVLMGYDLEYLKNLYTVFAK